MALGQMPSYKMIYDKEARLLSAAVGITDVKDCYVEIRPYANREGVNLSFNQDGGNFTVLDISRAQITETCITRNDEKAVTTIVKIATAPFSSRTAFLQEAVAVAREQQPWCFMTKGYSGTPTQAHVENPDEVARNLEDKATSARLALSQLGF